jgi:cobalamin biosynthesis protein CobT
MALSMKGELPASEDMTEHVPYDDECDDDDEKEDEDDEEEEEDEDEVHRVKPPNRGPRERPKLLTRSQNFESATYSLVL